MQRNAIGTPVKAIGAAFAIALLAGGSGVPAAAQAPLQEADSDNTAIADAGPPPDAAATPSPCTDWPYRAFDFWVGDWDVFDHNGNYVGRDLVSIEENGCLIVERWMATNGSTGQSYTYYNPASETWRQVWVSQSITIDQEGGYAADGGMALAGEISYRDGSSFPFRGQWTPNRNGTVTQLFEQFDPAADAWAPWFIAIYRRVEDNPEPPEGAAVPE